MQPESSPKTGPVSEEPEANRVSSLRLLGSLQRLRGKFYGRLLYPSRSLTAIIAPLHEILLLNLLTALQ